jgi:hypothetical protein
MTEGHNQEHPEDSGAAPVETPPAANGRADAAPPHRRSSGAAVWLAALLILVVVGIAVSPFWAPELAPLLPWGARSEPATESYAQLSARVAALDGVRSTVSDLQRRLDRLEAASPNGEVGAIKSQMSALRQRVDQIEAAGGGDRDIKNTVAGQKAELQELQERFAAVEAQSNSQAASAAANIQKIGQEVSRLGNVTADLGNRVGALDHELQSRGETEPRTDAILAMLLAQMRRAVEQARPFRAEYNAFTTLAHDPGLIAAAEPLAGAAQNGVASEAVLAKRLAELAGRVATGAEPATAGDWGAQALARLRGLVTIRRIDGGSQTGAEGVMRGAQSALARGDLAGAVAALDALSAANAEAARPWLHMARERLAVEAALDHLQELLTVRLGSAPAAPAGPPRAAPDEPPAKPRAPS